MPIPTFTQGYPPDGSSLGNTKLPIRNNLDGSFQVFSIDHESQNTIFPGAAGCHNKVTLKEITGSLPSGVFGPGYDTLYTKVANAGGQLFFVRGGAVTGIQLTGPGSPTPIVNKGYTFLPGGIMLQWGLEPGSNATSIPISFNPVFPTACLNVSVTPVHAATSPGSDFGTVVSTIPNTAGFTIGNIGGHTMIGWFWMAIGN